MAAFCSNVISSISQAMKLSLNALDGACVAACGPIRNPRWVPLCRIHMVLPSQVACLWVISLALPGPSGLRAPTTSHCHQLCPHAPSAWRFSLQCVTIMPCEHSSADTRGTICSARLKYCQQSGSSSDFSPEWRLQPSSEETSGPETLQAGRAAVPQDAKGQLPSGHP